MRGKKLVWVLLLVFLVGCDNSRLDIPNGEEVSHEEAQEIIDKATAALDESDNFELTIDQSLEGRFGGFFGLFADRMSFLMTGSLKIDEANNFHIMMESEMDGEATKVEVFHVDGTMFSQQNEEEWYEEEVDPDDIEAEEEWDYFDGLAQMEPSEYTMMETEEFYVVYVEVNSETEARRLDSLLIQGEEVGIAQSGFEELGMNYFGFLFEIDKETYLPHTYGIEMSGSDVVGDERVRWEQSLSGEYRYGQTETITAPTADDQVEEEEETPEEVVIEEDEELYEEELTEEEQEKLEIVERIVALEEEDLGYSYEAVYLAEWNGESWRRELIGEIADEYDNGHTVTVTSGPEESLRREDYWDGEERIYRQFDEGPWEFGIVSFGIWEEYNSVLRYIPRLSEDLELSRDGEEIRLLAETTLSNADTEDDSENWRILSLEERWIIASRFHDEYSELAIPEFVEYLSEQERTVRVDFRVDEASYYIHSFALIVEGENFRFSVQINYDNIGEIEEVIIPEEVVEEAEANE
jgi:hypothetical protein